MKPLKLASIGILGLSLLVLDTPASAQEETKCEPGAVDRKERASLIGERTFRRMSAISELIGNQEYNEALKALRALDKPSLNDYESAMVNQYLGYVYTGQGKYTESIPYFEKALQLDALPNAGHFGLMYSLAQLYAGEGQHQKTVDLMLQYLEFQCDPPPQAFIALASSYANLKQYDQALPWVQKAIEKAGDKAQESWYQLELAIYFDKGDYPSAARLLRSVLTRWPDKLKYWEMLSGAYQEQNKDLEALAALMVAYRKGLFEEVSPTLSAEQREKKLLNIVRMNLFVEVPFNGGEILEREMEAGRIQRTEKNLELLLSAWTAAREFDKAVATIDRLAPMKPDGEMYLQKAQLLAEKSDWSGTIDAARQAISKGGLKSPGGAYLLIGIAANELQDFQQAIEALKEARKFDEKSRRQASDWIKFVEDRMAVARG
jgi:tetratricopeptide (TPR) repeat protein